MYEKILVPLDGSKLAEEVLPLVSTIASNNNSEIVLLRVAEYPSDMYVRCGSGSFYNPEFLKTTAERKKTVRKELTKYLKKIASKLQQDGLCAIAEVCDGPVVDTILASIDRFSIDLIVMSSIGNSGGNPWMIGSIADRLLRESNVQVFLVRPNQRSKNSNLHQDHNPKPTNISKDRTATISNISI